MKWKYVKNCVISMLNSDYTINNKIDYIISILSIYFFLYQSEFVPYLAQSINLG